MLYSKIARTNLSGAISPLNAISPSFMGQVYKQSNGIIWEAGSLLSSGWIAAGYVACISWGPNSAYMHSYSNFSEGASPVDTEINFNGITGAGMIVLGDMPILETISAPVLETIDYLLQMLNLPALLNINFPLLQTVSGIASIEANAALANLSLPSLVTFGYSLTVVNNPALTSFSAPNWIPTNGQIISFTGNALNATSVNHILARCVAAGVTTCTIQLDGGTNAAPTGQGITDKAALITAGNTVTTN